MDNQSKSLSGNTISTSNSHNPVEDMPIVHPSAGALPTASVAYRGRTCYVPGNGTSTADIMYICLMSSTGTYSWKQIITG